MSNQPTGTNTVRKAFLEGRRIVASHINPAPPVIMIFLTSGRGSNLVVPINTGASFQTPQSSKNRLVGVSVEGTSSIELIYDI